MDLFRFYPVLNFFTGVTNQKRARKVVNVKMSFMMFESVTYYIYLTTKEIWHLVYVNILVLNEIQFIYFPCD